MPGFDTEVSTVEYAGGMSTDRHGGSQIIRALEDAWIHIQHQVPELPGVVITTGPRIIGSNRETWALSHPAEGGSVTISRDKTGRQIEVFISGERLRLGGTTTLQTLLHQATHVLAFVRGLQDTSRQHRYHNKVFRQLAAEVGLTYEPDSPNGRSGFSNVVMTEQTRARYVKVIKTLDDIILILITSNNPAVRPAGRGISTTLPKAVCGCPEPKIIRVAPSTLERDGGILCGACHEDFRIEPNDEGN